MDDGFVDLDLLVNRIREPGSKKYFQDAVRAYKAGALRPAITSTWVAIVYDLISKFRELAASNDASATKFVDDWDNATTNNNITKLLSLEKDILNYATNQTQIINQIDKRQLERIQGDRHLCAHPAFSSDALLFEPSHELSRLHLVNAIDLVLSREPLQGKAILEKFSADLLSPGFPWDYQRVIDYVEKKYIARTRPTTRHNLGIVLAKSLIKATPPEWEPHYSKVMNTLLALKERSPAEWHNIQAQILKLIETIDPEHRLRAIACVGQLPGVFAQLEQTTKACLIDTLRKIDVGSIRYYGFLVAADAEEFKQHISAIIDRFTFEQLQSAIANAPLRQLWPKALNEYRSSGSFAGSEKNFQTLIMPFAGTLQPDEMNGLFEAIKDNKQNSFASGTSELLEIFMKMQNVENYPSFECRESLYRMLVRLEKIEAYESIFDLLKADGWTPPRRVGEGA